MQRVNEIMSKFVDELGYDFANIMFNQISSGKKLRSKLILKIAGESEQSYVICAIIELIHLASLLHDDVIDNSLLRRGSPSINAKFGTKNAIMLGDILYSKGFFELSKFPHKISGTISKAVSLLSIGEMMDVELSKNFNVSHEKYKTMIYYKTAVLIEAAAEVGAIFYALDDNGKKQLKSLFKKQLNSKESAWIISKMNELGIIEKSVKIAKDLGREAIEAVGDFAGLDEIVKNMIDREF